MNINTPKALKCIILDLENSFLDVNSLEVSWQEEDEMFSIEGLKFGNDLNVQQEMDLVHYHNTCSRLPDH